MKGQRRGGSDGPNLGLDLRPSNAGVWFTVSSAAISQFSWPSIPCLVSACGWVANGGFLRGQV